MRKTLTALLLIAVATPAAASDCGEATWTNNSDQPVTVTVQIKEGYAETTVDAGETLTYWDAAPGSHWAIWHQDGALLASGKQCGEDETFVNVEAPDPEPAPVVVDVELEPVEAPSAPVGVFPI